jgi:hypothetical protein
MCIPLFPPQVANISLVCNLIFNPYIKLKGKFMKNPINITLFASLFWLSGCLIDNEDATSRKNKENTIQTSKTVWMQTTDNETGKLHWMTKSDTEFSTDFISIHNDSKIKKSGDYLWVLERYLKDNILKIDPTQTGSDAVLWQISLEDGSNPHDLVFINNKIYVSLNNADHILILNPATGAQTGTLDIADYAVPGNTSPNASNMVALDDKLYVVLQRLDGWAATEPGQVLEIDVNTNAITNEYTLNLANPGELVVNQDELIVCSRGSTYPDPIVQGLDGSRGIEKIDLSTGEAEIIITDEELGGSPSSLVHKSGTDYFVGVYIGFGNNPVVELDLHDLSMNTIAGVTDAFNGFVYDQDSDLLFIAESDFNGAGLLIWNGSILEGPIGSNLLPPGSIALTESN